MSGSNSSNPGGSVAAAEQLGLTVHSVDPALAGPSTSRGRIMAMLVLLVCAAPVILSYFMYYVVRPDGRNNYAELIQPTRGMPAHLELRRLDGQTVPVERLKGQWLLVVVSSGACTGACENLLFAQRQLREMLGRERDRLDKLWLIVDDAAVPAPVLTAVQATPAVTVLRAQPERVREWLQPEVGHHLEDHLYLVDPMGEWMMRTPESLDPSKFKKDLERLLRASASWDRPGRDH